MDEVQAFSQPSAEIFTSPEFDSHDQLDLQDAPINEEELHRFFILCEQHLELNIKTIRNSKTKDEISPLKLKKMYEKAIGNKYQRHSKALYARVSEHLREIKNRKKREEKENSKTPVTDEKREKLTRAEARVIANEAMIELVQGVLMYHFAYAPISEGDSPLYAFYSKRLAELPGGIATLLYRKVCFNTQQIGSISIDLAAECNDLGIGTRIEELHAQTTDRLGGYAGSLIGADWRDFIEKAFQHLQMRNRDLWGDSILYQPVDPLKDVEAEQREGRGIPGCFLPPAPRTNHCDSWNDFLERCSDPLMFCVWFARLFDPKDNGRQALVLRGPGQTGTSVLVNALHSIMGELSKTEPEDYNQFTVPLMAGARLITVPDVEDHYYLMHARFKQRTGGDVLRGEIKYGGSGQVKIFSKVLVTTNKRLYINPLLRWSTSRAIILDFKSIDANKIKDSKKVCAALVAQFPYFLERARAVNDAYTAKYRVNEVDIPVTYTTMLRMRNAWERVSAILYKWIHTNVMRVDEDPYAMLLAGCDGSDESHYRVHNFLTDEELIKPVNELMKKQPDAKKEERIQQTLHNVKDYIAAIYGISEVTRSYRANDGATVTVMGFPGLQLKEDIVDIKKLPPEIYDTLEKAPRPPLFYAPMEGLYLGEYIAGFNPTPRKKGVTKSVLDQIF